MEDGDTEKYHPSKAIQDFVSENGLYQQYFFAGI